MAKRNTRSKRTGRPAKPVGEAEAPQPDGGEGGNAGEASGAGPAGPPFLPDSDLGIEASGATGRLVCAYSYLRWTVRFGRPPTAAEWSGEEAAKAGWPDPDYVERSFAGGWAELETECGIAEAELFAVQEQAGEARRRAAQAERSAERKARRVRELERRAEQASERRRKAEDERDREARGREAVEREAERLRDRTAELEARLSDAEAPPSDALGRERARAEAREGELMAERDAQIERREAAEDALHASEERAQRAGERVRELEREVSRLARELAIASGQGTPVEAEAEMEHEPSSVLEAVELAAAEAEALRFADSAYQSAADSPFTDAAQILDALRRLDRVAVRHAAGSMGRGLRDVAVEEGILDWAGGISETTRTRYAEHYTFRHAGRELMMDAHVGLGAGKGAGQVARIYLHVADGRDPDLGRGIIVAHVGRHLPDTTT